MVPNIHRINIHIAYSVTFGIPQGWRFNRLCLYLCVCFYLSSRSLFLLFWLQNGRLDFCQAFTRTKLSHQASIFNVPTNASTRRKDGKVEAVFPALEFLLTVANFSVKNNVLCSLMNNDVLRKSEGISDVSVYPAFIAHCGKLKNEVVGATVKFRQNGIVGALCWEYEYTLVCVCCEKGKMSFQIWGGFSIIHRGE